MQLVKYFKRLKHIAIGVINMKYIEIEKYKVKCILEESELFSYGATVDDILARKPGTMEFMKIIRQKVMEATDYDWPGCAFSSQIEVMKNGDLAITFSETIDDFVYNLKQIMTIDESSANVIKELIDRIEESDDLAARALIKKFEENVRSIGMKK